MKIKNRVWLLLLMLLCVMLTGQQVKAINKLSIPDVVVGQGATIALPVNLENDDPVVAVQFTLTVPDGFTVNTSTSRLTERKADHTLRIKRMQGNDYLCMIYSPANTALNGNRGSVLNIMLTAPSQAPVGDVYPLMLKDAVASDASMDDVLNGFSSGNITIAEGVDLVPTSVVANEANCQPGGFLALSWSVENVGQISTTGGWSERVSLVDGDGNVCQLGTATYDATLSGGGSVSRQAEFAIPLLHGLGDDIVPQVTVIPDAGCGERVEARSNNTAQGGEISMSDVLYLEVPQANVPENTPQAVKCRVSRSGQWQTALQVHVTCDDRRLTIPSPVTIPAGHSGIYFYITLEDNQEMNDDAQAVITADATGYDAVTAMLNIEDDERPMLTASASTRELSEGQVFTVTLTTDRRPRTDLTVQVACSLPARFDFPADVTIAAGETSTEFQVTAVDDNTPDIDQEVTFAFSADGHQSDEVWITLHDNDVPDIELSLTPATVSEISGTNAVLATLRRLNHIDNAITFILSDDSNGLLKYSSSRITMDAGVNEMKFAIGVNDNDVVDGDRTVNVTAAIYIKSCSCQAQGGQTGSVTRQLIVTDNDGPAITITSSRSTVGEGSDAILTVSRNAYLDQAVTVNLSSDNDADLTYSHQVTIPAGEKSVMIRLSVGNNNQTDDGRIVALQAVADGFSTGSCWIMISNQTLPDAQIVEFSLSGHEIMIGELVTATVTVANSGSAPLPSQLRTVVYLNDGSELCRMYTQSVLEPGQTERMTKTFEVPQIIGNHEVYAVVNDGLKVQELMTSNNRSENQQLSIQSPFSTTLTTDKAVYQTGESILFNGSVTGTDVGSVTVEIYLINDGCRQTLTAITDASGHFAATYTPFAAQMGHFMAGACYPGENAKEVMTAFDIVGLRRTTNGYLTCDVLLNEQYELEIGIENPSHIDLHNIHVNVLSKPDNYDFSFESISSLPSGGKTNVLAHVLGKALTSKNEWEQARIEIISDEGARTEATLYLYCRNPRAQLKADIVTINTTMTKGQTRDYPFYISNIGKGSTGNITLSLPDWMTTATPANMASLEQNESAQIVLRLTPTDDMQLNVPRTGTIAINCENGDGIAIPYRIEPVSETTGTLIVDVCDEYTWNTAAAPHVAGASVIVKHPTTGAVVAEGTTGADGVFQATLPEGYYALYVSANKHDSYSNYIIVDPGRENRKVVNISIQAINFSFEVEPTEIKDIYDIVINADFETNVPKPVVTIEGPARVDGGSLAVGESLLFYLTLNNHGLMDALNTQLLLPENNPYWSFKALAYTEPFTLGANQSVVVPVLLTKLSTPSNPDLRWYDDQFVYDACLAGVRARYQSFCETVLETNEAAYAMALDFCETVAAMNYILDRLSEFYQHVPYIPIHFPEDGTDGEINLFEIDNFDKNQTICNPQVACRYNAVLQALISQYNSAYSVFLNLLGIFKDWRYNHSFDWGSVRNLSEMLFWRGLHQRLDEKYNFLLELIERIRNEAENAYGYSSCQGDVELPSPPPPVPDMPDSNPVVDIKSESNGIPSSGIAWIDDFTDNYIDLYLQFKRAELVLTEFFEDSVWWTENDEGINQLFEKMTQISQEEFTYENMLNYKPESVSNEQLKRFIDRIINTIDGNSVEPNIDMNIVGGYSDQFFECDSLAKKQGYESLFGKFEESYNNVMSHFKEESNSVCSTVSLQFSSRMVMTRQAFRATLKVYNGSDSVAMRDVKLFLTVTDEDGKLATSHEFQVNPESLEGFEGELALDAGWSLGAKETGVATVLFIPTKYAAPAVDRAYTFAGTLSYIDPFVNELVTRSLTPQTLTVKPSADLELDYFLQRDVFGDDPLTEEVEPMIPSEFALLINNKGYGDAFNVQVTTAQPEITENKKGLSIDFSLLNGDKGDLGLDVINDFGTIAAMSQTYAQWWLLSSLTGHFTKYDASFTHVTSYGNPDLSLIDTVRVHELIHGFTAGMDGEKPLRGFLVNDLPDANDLPDVIHFTNATQDTVAMSTATVTRMSNSEFLLTVTSGAPGWNYGKVLDPTAGKQKMVKVIRQSDGAVLYADNVWCTDRTLRDGHDPLYENLLHYVVFMTGMTENYVITFEPIPDTELSVESFGGIPAEGVILSEPLTSLTVKFNKPVQTSTFTVDDIRLSCNGNPLDLSSVIINQLSDDTFEFDLTDVTIDDGFYVLIVQTANILDQEGYNGSTGKEAVWTQLAGGKILLTVSVEPEGCGTVNPEDGLYDYGSTVHMIAVSKFGYAFMYWMLEGVEISRDAEFDFLMLDNSHLTAVFQPILCNVEISYDPQHGSVIGASSQVYHLGTELELEAVPAQGYQFDYWLVNGGESGNNPILELTVDDDIIIEARFKTVAVMEVTPAPTIQTVVNPNEVIITAIGNGVVLLYIDGVRVDNPVSIARSGEDVTITITATAQEDGKLISETTTQVFVIPKVITTGVKSLIEDKNIASIRYFNMMGQEMTQIRGATIVVISYNDGSTQVLKVMR